MLLIIAASHQKNLVLAKKVSAAAGELGLPAKVLDLTELSIPVYS